MLQSKSNGYPADGMTFLSLPPCKAQSSLYFMGIRAKDL